MDIKLLNAKLEQFVSQQLEPLLSINWRLGLPYPQTAIDNIWRKASHTLMKVSADVILIVLIAW